MTQDVSNGGASEQTHSHVDLGWCSCRISRKSRHWTQNTNTYISFKTHQHKNSKNQHFTAKEIWADPRGKKNQNLQLSNLIYEHQSSNKVSTFKAIAKFLSLVILPDGDDDQSCADKHHWQSGSASKSPPLKQLMVVVIGTMSLTAPDRKVRPMDHRFSLEVTEDSKVSSEEVRNQVRNGLVDSSSGEETTPLVPPNLITQSHKDQSIFFNKLIYF